MWKIKGVTGEGFVTPSEKKIVGKVRGAKIFPGKADGELKAAVGIWPNFIA